MTEVYQFIAAGQAVYPVTLLCRVLGMVRPSFYAWLEAEQDRRARERADEASEPATSTPTAPAPDQGHLRLPPQGTAASAHQHHARHPRPMWN
ncbi:hypothetical protein PH213_30510 [Streptomyces sp. SRF1]|uniref:hypothetical protein n=1 Tax=Streptomyces sp. SRF1 TaxID=1549642 RepID=UPI0025B0A7AD|nr:hypothetical protein [Streptomyces sp. SRF1]MDN3058804.1 hypothetical protein [Streptomyces sp. SRF1]